MDLNERTWEPTAIEASMWKATFSFRSVTEAVISRFCVGCLCRSLLFGVTRYVTGITIITGERRALYNPHVDLILYAVLFSFFFSAT